MRLRSVLEKHPGAGILWTGVTGKVATTQNPCLLVLRYFTSHSLQVHNELPAGGSIDMTVSLLPLLPGLQVFI